MKRFFLLTLLIALSISFYAQSYDELKITTGVPFLTINPDARGGSMGDVGATTTSDITSIFYNPAKYSFAEQKAGLQISYSPWLTKISSDMSINYLAGYFKISENQAFAASLKYFRIGEIMFTDEYGQNITAVKPNELAISGAYSLKLNENLSGAINLKFIYSNLTGGINTNGTSSHAGIAAAGDLSFFYNKPIMIKSNDAEIRWGINLSNMGTKISYGTIASPFIPANLRTGIGFKYYIDEFNTIELGVDLNKLMVPTPATFDTLGNVVNGTDPEVGPTEGIIRSFYDGQNFQEELHEIMIGTGLEYTYNNTVFLRGGLFYESPYKGGRRYVTTGVGFKFNVFNIDFSYLVPIYSHSPLEATLRFTLSFYFNKNFN